MNIRKLAGLAAGLLLVAAVYKLHDGLADYIDYVKSGLQQLAAPVSAWPAAADGSRLYERIRQEADKRFEPPVNAVVDRIWKAIPGYNGREVDIEQTYIANAGIGPEDEITYIYREIEPEIGLDQLGPHPIYRGNPRKAMVSLMINVAWGNEYLEPMLDTLDREGVKATFFLDGSWLSKYPDYAKAIQKRGHEISNHAYSHPDMSKLSRAAAYQQIDKTEKLLRSVLGVTDNRWFAPPSGDYNQTTVEIAAELGLKTVLWTIDTVDWKKPPADAVVAKISAKLEPGSLILMHPTSTSRDALAGIIAAAKKKGYALGTVSETLSSRRAPVEGRH
jgi:probable sporulation protein (polysaccharide deacetylase family)